ncbi:hypothetical protein PSGK_10145 [Pseudomonas solani]|uniref:hypothetical protein n=1 Tax=Pseudomonas solani TaxID=2731552 RepID=UPI0035BE941A
MAHANSLWSSSSAWRWTLCLTLLTSALFVLLAPWRPLSLASTGPGQGQYTPSVVTPPGQLAGSLVLPSVVLHNALDPALDTSVVLPTATFSSDTELHVIGVYEGALPEGEKEKPWWSNCTALSDEPAAMMACHSKYAGQRTTKTITVYVNRTSAPMVLALMAYEPVRWKIVARPATDLRKVILSGNHGQDIEGVSDSTPVEVYSDKPSSCMNCTRQSGSFYAYKQDSPEYAKAMTKLQALTGLAPASFQGAYKSDRFTIVGGTAPMTGSKQADPYTGKVYNNYVGISQKTLLLPDGDWQALAYVETPSSRGADHLLVLTQNDNGRLSELMVIRLQTARDNQGFSQYQACDQAADYVKKVSQNEALGPQLCYWANHIATPWQQPIYRLAAQRLAAHGLTLPDTALGMGFHRADTGSSLTTLYYSFPVPQTQSSSSTDWSKSSWNPKLIGNYPENSKFLKQRMEWAEGWYQIFSVTD